MKYFCPFYWLGAGGGRDSHGEWGRVRGPNQRFFYARFGWKTRYPSRGRGDREAYINPLPQAAITIENAHHARPRKHNICLEIQYWLRAPSHAPPPTCASRPPSMFFCSMSITKYAADYAQRIFWSSVHCLYSLYVCLSRVQHALLIYQIINSVHVYTLLKGHCIKRRHRHMLQIPVNII
jgi:hypothetical protein